MKDIFSYDPEIGKILSWEWERQKDTLVLIASENYVSEAVLQAQGCIMTNKYAEGYPEKRWYSGCKFVDMAESLAIKRAKELFGADHVNVQPHTGTQANMAAYYAFLNPGDTIMCMQLTHGGHLSHGSKENFSGRYYNAVFYGVDRETGWIDYNEAEKIAKQSNPKLIVVGYSAYPRVVDFKRWKEIADSVGAHLVADIAHIVGLVAADLHPDPVPYADIITSTTHKTLRGPRGAFIMCKKKYKESIDKAVFPGIQAGPLMHIIAAKAVAFKEAMKEEFKDYQRQIISNSKALAEGLKEREFKLVTGGTDNHMVLIDLTDKGITGKDASDLLEEVGILVNKNTIPYDKRSTYVTSGIRIGTPAVTTRGMKEDDMKRIAKMIGDIVNNPDDHILHRKIKKDVEELLQSFPIYQNYKGTE